MKLGPIHSVVSWAGLPSRNLQCVTTQAKKCEGYSIQTALLRTIPIIHQLSLGHFSVYSTSMRCMFLRHEKRLFLSYRLQIQQFYDSRPLSKRTKELDSLIGSSAEYKLKDNGLRGYTHCLQTSELHLTSVSIIRKYDKYLHNFSLRSN